MLSRMRHLIAAATAVAVSLPAALTAQSGDGPHGSKYQLSTIAPGVVTLTWQSAPGTYAIGNSTFIIGDSDVIVIDTGQSKMSGEATLRALRQVTAKPVSLVSNQAFKNAFPAVRVVAHSETRPAIIAGEFDYRTANRPKTEARILELRAKPVRTDAEANELRFAEMQVELWQGDYVLPDVLVHDRLTLMQGERRLEVLHLGHANTKGDLVVHLPAERIVISGDMAITPVPFAFFSSPRAWIVTLDKLAALDAATVVAGHGAPQTDTRFIRDLQAMLRSIVEQVDAGRKAGQDLDALKKSVTLTPPAGSIYAKAPPQTIDRLFRIPAIESAWNEK
jgi:glyoxylase-like metal-dependent hydrolase (beta-lactamase superfamily II)